MNGGSSDRVGGIGLNGALDKLYAILAQAILIQDIWHSLLVVVTLAIVIAVALVMTPVLIFPPAHPGLQRMFAGLGRVWVCCCRSWPGG